MGTFLQDLLKKMKTAPHVGIPPVTNSKGNAKVKREVAPKVKQKPIPKFNFGKTNTNKNVPKRIVTVPHPTQQAAESTSTNEWDAEYQAFVANCMEMNPSQKDK